MTEQELIALQKQLDERKYFQSQTVRLDLGGRMPYCQDCYFAKFDIEKGHTICNLDESSKTENQVCAKNYLRLEEKNGTKRDKEKSTQCKPRTTRKTNNGKS